MEIEKLYRYPGAVSFTTEQTHLFNGRDRDAKMLWQLISARQVILLYGKSGTGKSSLINAGIIPIIENEKKVKHFSIRLYNSNQGDNKISSSPLKTLIANLKTPQQTKETSEEVLIEQPWMNRFKKEAYPQGELWYWLKQWQIQQPEKTILLFFDQFEELFTYPQNEIEDFGEELKLLIYQNIPDFLNRRELFKELDETQTALLYEKVNLKLVFSIRSDRMALLNKLTPFIPDVLKYFYELDALTEDAAKEAIKIPAQIEGDFQTPTFQYEDKVVDAIIERVKNKHDGKIETATLQIICRFIELQKVSQSNSIITLNDLGNIKDIFRDFYQSTLNQLKTRDKAKVSKSIEERFIQNNQRIPFAGEYLKLEDKWTDELFKQLEESTLLRKERDTAGRFIYEIGHDALIEPILEFARRRSLRFRTSLSTFILFSIVASSLLLFTTNYTQKALDLSSEIDIYSPVQEFNILVSTLDFFAKSGISISSDLDNQNVNPQSIKVKDIKRKIEYLFNNSNQHQWNEKLISNNIDSVYFSSNGNFILSDNFDLGIQVYKNQNLEPPFFLKRNERVASIYISNNDKWLIIKRKVKDNWNMNYMNYLSNTKESNNTKPKNWFEYEVWDLHNKNIPNFLKEKKIRFASFSDNEELLLTLNDDADSNPKIFNVKNGKYVEIKTIQDSSIGINNALFSSNNRWIVANLVKFKKIKTLKNPNIPNDTTTKIIYKRYYTYKIFDTSTGESPSFNKSQEKKIIKYATISKDSKYYLTIDTLNKINIWDLEQMKLDTSFVERSISSIVFSSNSKWMVIKKQNEVFQIVNINSKRKIQDYNHKFYFSYVEFSPNCEWVVTKDIQGGMILWNVDDDKWIEFFRFNYVKSIYYSHDSNWLITINENNEVKLLNLDEDKKRILFKNTETEYFLNMSQNNNKLITINKNREKRTWGFERGNINVHNNSNFIHEDVKSLQYSPNNDWVITKNGLNVTKFWQTQNKSIKLFRNGRVVDVIKSHSDNLIENEYILIKNDTSYLGVMKYTILDLNTGKSSHLFNNKKEISEILFSQNGRWLLTKEVQFLKTSYSVWDVKSGREIYSMKNTDNILDIFFSHDNKYGYILTNKGLQEWDIKSGQRYNYLEDKNINDINFSSDKKHFLTRSKSGKYDLWSIDRKKRENFLSDEKNIRSVLFSLDSKMLIIVKNHKKDRTSFRVRNIYNNKIYNFSFGDKKIKYLSFSQDNKYLFTRDINNNFKVWKINHGKIYNFLKEEENIRDISFSEDSKLLSITTDHQVKTYETATGKLIQTLWLNKKPKQIDIIDNRYLYVTVGKAIVKTDLQTQKGNLMSFGDGEPLDYKYDEIIEWKKVFEKEYLLPLDEKIKKKYSIK